MAGPASCVYISARSRWRRVRLRASGLACRAPVQLAAETSVEDMSRRCRKTVPRLIVIDSIPDHVTDTVESAPAR